MRWQRVWSIGTASVLTAAGLSVLPGLTHAASPTGGRFKGTITFYAQAYNTPKLGVDYLAKVLIPRYEALHPGVKIRLLSATAVGGNNYETWVRTKAAAGQLVDIGWNLPYPYINTQLPYGTYVNLRPYLKQPDPYVAGHPPWGTLFPKSVINAMTSPNQAIYAVVGDAVAAGIFYNKAIFAKAHISSPPATWAQFVADCAKIKQAGYIPFDWPLGSGQWWFVEIWAREFYSMLYSNQIASLAVSHQRYHALSPLDEVVAIKDGRFTATSPRWALPWKLFAQLVDKGYIAKGVDSRTLTDDQTLFAKGKLAMYWDGSYDLKLVLQEIKHKFAMGTMPWPQLTKATSPLATGAPSHDTGGPGDGAFSFAIASPQADHSMTPAKLRQAVNFMMFLTTPQNDQAMVNQSGEFIPVIKGAKPKPQLAQYVLPLLHKPSDTTDGGTLLTSQASNQFWSNLQALAAGQITLKQYLSESQSVMETAASQLIAQNHWNIAKYEHK